MKKIIIPLFFAVTVMMGFNLHAQDTVWQKPGPLSNYYNNIWIDTTIRYTGYTAVTPKSHAMARRFVANKDTLQVYGIAAMMVNYDSFDFWPSPECPDLQSLFKILYPNDPTFDHCEESLLLFQYHGGPSPTMQQLGDSLKVHILHTPVSYWMMSGAPLMCRFDTFPKPVYERYFSTPQTVYDTFYAGFTQTDGGFSPVDSIWRQGRPEFSCLEWCYSNISLWPVVGEGEAAYRQGEIDSTHTWIFRDDISIGTYFLFPILTPAPPDTVVNPNDTTVNPNDTIVNPNDTTGVGIGERELLQRYVAVSPNPATSSATVTSSFGLSQVDLYDPQGRLLKTFPAASKASSSSTSPATLSLTLDLSAYPRGTYLLRILTPLGPTTKKLLLQ